MCFLNCFTFLTVFWQSFDIGDPNKKSVFLWVITTPASKRHWIIESFFLILQVKCQPGCGNKILFFPVPKSVLTFLYIFVQWIMIRYFQNRFNRAYFEKEITAGVINRCTTAVGWDGIASGAGESLWHNVWGDSGSCYAGRVGPGEQAPGRLTSLKALFRLGNMRNPYNL